ncbi:MAG: hypothetical protein AUJ97_07740 [Bacteroidetes bacterium CG2_30_32_10]|nr:MAG: hypothetical protein AUJ97_07740 [Bacteroidetes bacterium CG2_30_32_10]
MGKIRIAIIDDHDLFREGIKLVLNQIDEFEVVFDHANGLNFIEFLKNSIPDIVLMDINMPEIDGIETTKKAIDLFPELKIIALSMFSDTLHYSQMINAGVRGFVLKKTKKHELQQAIIEVYNGGVYFSQEIIQKLAFQSLNFSKKLTEDITNREFDILDLVCQGKTSQEISEKLFISPKTVEVHRTNILRKADVRNTAELIIWAVKNNYFSIK